MIGFSLLIKAGALGIRPALAGLEPVVVSLLLQNPRF